MTHIVRKFFWAVDFLLPCALAFFLLPFDPRLSVFPVILWIVIQLMSADQSLRLVSWPWLALLLLSARAWWFNDPPHPASTNDAVLLISGILAGLTISPYRWNRLLLLPVVGFVPLIFSLSSKPWSPNPFVGANQAGYLFGIFLSISLTWLLVTFRWSWSTCLKACSVLITFTLLWQTGSRAALISSMVGSFIPFLVWQYKRNRFWITLLSTGILASLFYFARVILSSSSALPGFKSGSDLGRLLAYDCFFGLPFTGGNRFVYGVGFERVQELCQVEFQGSVLAHAHNLYLQIWASTGILGIGAICLLAVLIVQQYSYVRYSMPINLSMCWQSVCIYTVVQGIFDASLLHWPITLLMTGILMGVPFSFRPVSAK